MLLLLRNTSRNERRVCSRSAPRQSSLALPHFPPQCPYSQFFTPRPSIHPPLNSPLHQLHTMADKLRTQQQLESLQNKYIGTGHADTTKHEWTSNIARDSYASYQGHPPLLHYMAIGMGTSMEKVRMQCMEKMVLPVGPAPERDGAT